MAYGMAVPIAKPTMSQSAVAALSDAQAFLETRGPMSAVDRVLWGRESNKTEIWKVLRRSSAPRRKSCTGAQEVSGRPVPASARSVAST
jgi:hypothetical protein